MTFRCKADTSTTRRRELLSKKYFINASMQRPAWYVDLHMYRSLFVTTAYSVVLSFCNLNDCMSFQQIFVIFLLLNYCSLKIVTDSNNYYKLLYIFIIGP